MCRGLGGQYGFRHAPEGESPGHGQRGEGGQAAQRLAYYRRTDAQTQTDSKASTRTEGERRGGGLPTIFFPLKEEGLSCDVRHSLGGCMGFFLDGVSGVAKHVCLCLCVTHPPRAQLCIGSHSDVFMRACP